MKWISVKDKSPKNYKDVIGYAYGSMTNFDKMLNQHGHNYLIVFKKANNQYALSFNNEDVNITHWAPLPPPPKEQ